MRIISWNINSVRARLNRLLDVLRRHQPDVLCLQETKVSDIGGFPIMQVGSLGYRSILHGQESYNGVAILVKDSSRKSNLLSFGNGASSEHDVSEIIKGFPNNPLPSEARVISAVVSGVRIVNAYVVNGQDIISEQFSLKEKWMGAFGKWLHDLPENPPLLIVGDFNVAPDDRDVWDPEGLRDRIHCTAEERLWLKNLQGQRFLDILRASDDKPRFYTWWPYQRGALERDEGFRFDLILGDREMADKAKRLWVDKKERSPVDGLERPSDHAPLVLDI